MATLEGMVQHVVHFEAFKGCIEVAISICLESLVEADLILVVLADDTDFS